MQIFNNKINCSTTAIFGYLSLLSLIMKMNTKDKKNHKTVKLPQIHNHKTASSFASDSGETSFSRIRPNSTSKVGELEKNLFNQLDQYDDMGKKPLRKIKTKKEIEGIYDGAAEVAVDLEVPYLKKLEKCK